MSTTLEPHTLALDDGNTPYLCVPRITRVLKRAFDVGAALAGLLVASPLFLLIAVLIKLDTPGPVFFRQQRVGLRRRNFLMWKFRKMPHQMPKAGPSLTRRHDHRLTTVGRFLERTKLDELPQLLNVLWGDMSIVGPRPEVPKFVPADAGLWDTVLSVKPGLFGPNQLRYRNESELYPSDCDDLEAYYVRHILPHKLAVDADYARRCGLGHDLGLLLRCVLVVLLGTVTWQTLSTRRWQILNFVILSVLGVAGMIMAYRVAGVAVDQDTVLATIVLAVVAKPLCLLAFKIPKALATSMTADDFLRIWWCAVTSSGLLVTGSLFLGHRDVSRLVVVLDAGFFVTLLLMYKLTLYKVYITFYRQGTDGLARRLVLASVLLAPLSLGIVVLLRHGWGDGEGLDTPLYVTLLILVTVVRPLVLLLKPLRAHAGVVAWLAREGKQLALGTLVGSAAVACLSVVVNMRGIGRGDILADTALYLVSLTAVACWQNHRLTGTSRRGPTVSRVATERILIVGAGIELSSYVAALAALPEHSYEVVGIVTPHPNHRTSMVGGHPIIGHLHDVPALLETADISRVIVLRSTVEASLVEELERRCRARTDCLVRVELLTALLPWQRNGHPSTGRPHLGNGTPSADDEAVARAAG